MIAKLQEFLIVFVFCLVGMAAGGLVWLMLNDRRWFALVAIWSTMLVLYARDMRPRRIYNRYSPNRRPR